MVKPSNTLVLLFFFGAACDGNGSLDSHSFDELGESASELTISGEEVYESGDSFRLSEDEFRDALNNSQNDKGEGAFDIFMHLYSGWNSDGIRPNDKDYWLNLAVEKGNFSAIQFRISLDLDQMKPDSCRRALADLRRLAKDSPDRFVSVQMQLSELKINECESMTGQSAQES